MNLPDHPKHESPKNWMVVVVANSMPQASIFAGRLESLGVPVHMQYEAAAAAMGWLISGGGVKVLVPESHYEFAIATLFPDEDMARLTDGEDDDYDDEDYFDDEDDDESDVD